MNPRTIPVRVREKTELLYKPPVDVQVELIATDKNGNVECKRKFRCHSFLANWLQFHWSFYNQSAAAKTTGTDITGTTRTIVPQLISTPSTTPSAATGTGANIVVGTSSTAPAFGDSAMGGQAGRISATLGTPLIAATSKFTLTGTISFPAATTINEVGVELPMVYSTVAAAFLMIHDNVSGGFAVSAGGSITVVYTISVTT